MSTWRDISKMHYEKFGSFVSRQHITKLADTHTGLGTKIKGRWNYDIQAYRDYFSSVKQGRPRKYGIGGSN